MQMAENFLPLIIVVQLSAAVAGILLLRSATFDNRSLAVKLTIATAISAAMAIFVFAVSEPHLLFNDFRKAYYPTGQAMLEDRSALAPLIESVMFVNLPVVAYLFAPLGLFSFKAAAVIFLLLGTLATLWAWALLAREAQLSTNEKWVLLLLFAACGPLLYSFKEGNTSHMVLLGLVAALILMTRSRNAAAGAVLGICALVKLPLLIFGAYFLLRRNWPATIAFSATLAIAGVLSVLIFGWELNQRWFELCVVQFSRNPIGAFNVQSVPGFLLRLEGGAEIMRDWSAVPVGPLHKVIGTGSSLLMFAIAIAVCARRPHADNDAQSKDWLHLEYALVVTLAVVSSPMSWSHYYCWLLIPVAFFLGEKSAVALPPAARRIAWIATALLLPAIGLMSFSNPALEVVYVKFAASYLLACGLLWFALLIWALASKKNYAHVNREVTTRAAL
jgi:hypothetical protein